jgi:hypothetical protein
MKSKIIAVFDELVNVACIAILVGIVFGIAFIVISPEW